MDQADSVHSTPPINTSLPSDANPLAEAPASPPEGLYIPTDVTPEELFLAIGRLRKEARDEINRLIQFLDKTDDYVSRELEDAVDDVACDGDADDEPSIGSPEIINQDRAWQGGASMSVQLDLEADDCDKEESDPAEHGGDDEPSLGWTIDGHCEGFDDLEADGETKGSSR